MRVLVRMAVAGLLVLLPALASAQAALSGVVRDSSGAVLPGVTVEAASPALIERVRSTVTDGNGQYRLVDLRPGTYAVTFSVQGFTSVRRDGVVLSGTGTTTVNAELTVGALAETITVSGVAPTIDVQSATRQRVLDKEVVDALPTGRQPYNLAVLVPGVSVGNITQQDVGGSQGDIMPSLVVHGSRTGDQRITQNGLSLGTLEGGGQLAGASPNLAAIEEIVLDTAAVNAEQPTGGVRMNFIPREGGNNFSGSLFGAFTNGSLQGSNLSDDLVSRGLRTPNSVKEVWDVNPGFGGPLLRDRLWFYTSVRHTGANNYVAGMFVNRNANNPQAWTYDPDPSQPASNDTTWRDAQLRLTWQASQRNKFAASWDQQTRCSCPWNASATVTPEAGFHYRFPRQRAITADWSSPVSSQLLLDAALVSRVEGYNTIPTPGLPREMISVTEQSTGITYRARASYGDVVTKNVYYRASIAYVPGSHALKIGFNNGYGSRYGLNYSLQPVAYRFNNGVPNQITLNATPYSLYSDLDSDFGLYAQDRWTADRLTLTAGVRFDYFATSFPAQQIGPAPLTPTRNISFPEQDGVGWKDVTPKLGAVYDVFGDGRTALKVSLNKYVQGFGMLSPLVFAPQPVNRLVTTTTRSWADADRDFVPDCELANAAANGECGALANSAFGSALPGTSFDPDVLRGWNSRAYNWEFSLGAQRELLPGLSVDAGYFRRWYGNFTVVDNLTVAPGDFDQFSLTGPADSRLPDGGSAAITGLYDLNPSKFGLPAQNLQTFAKKYGKQIEHWNGVDIGVSARLAGGVLMQGGISTGRTSTDNCDVVNKLDNPSTRFCHVDTNFLTQAKAYAAYTIPRADVQVSGTFQSLPGPAVAANWNAPASLAAASLGRPLSGGAANVTVNLVEPGTMYGDRINQLDLRVGKVLRLNRVRATANFDLYNALNANPVLAESTAYAIWRAPQGILSARLAKFSVNLTF